MCVINEAVLEDAPWVVFGAGAGDMRWDLQRRREMCRAGFWGDEED